MNFLFKLLLTFNATSWMLVVYGIKEEWTWGCVPRIVVGIVLLMIPVMLSLISIVLAGCLSKDTLNCCQDYSLADNEFLSTYLGYFFVSLSVTDNTTMVFMYIIVFTFTFLSQTQYFNPIYLLFGYHFYHVQTPKGTKIFVIAKGPVRRSKNQIYFSELRRINDTTYLERKGKNK